MRLIFIPIAVLVIFGLMGAHVVIYRALMSLLNIKPVLLRFLVFLPLPLFIIISILSAFKNNIFTRVVYSSLAVMPAILVYFFFSACLFFLLKNIPGFNYILAGRVLFSVSMIAIIYGIFNANNLRVHEINIQSDKLSPWRGKTTVWISDLHLGQVRGRSFTKRVVSEINKVSPDMVFIGGDLFDGVAVDLEDVTEPLTNLNPKSGTFFITGNHEEFRDPEKYLSVVRARGIKVLFNDVVEIDGVQLAGLDFLSGGGNNFDSAVLKLALDIAKPSVLLKHAPTDLAKAEKYGFNLVIAGHTHRAQMWPLSFISQLVFKGYDHGLKKFGDMIVYTSTGAGTWGPPVRIISDPEIAVLRFK